MDNQIVTRESKTEQLTNTQKKTLDERRLLLSQQVQMAVSRGGSIQSQSDTMAVILYGKPVNHILHLILTLVTMGFWVIIWIILALSGGVRREMITIDDYGNVLVTKA